MSERNLTLLTDLYELTMMQGYFKSNSTETVILMFSTEKIRLVVVMLYAVVLNRLLIT